AEEGEAVAFDFDAGWEVAEIPAAEVFLGVRSLGDGGEALARGEAELAADGVEVAAGGERAALLVDHAEVHVQVGGQFLRLEIAAVDGGAAALAEEFGERIEQRLIAGA